MAPPAFETHLPIIVRYALRPHDAAERAAGGHRGHACGAIAAVGAWVDAGSRDETPVRPGLALPRASPVQGPDDWSAPRIGEAFDAVGARYNAFTSKEYTCYWARFVNAPGSRGRDSRRDASSAGLPAGGDPQRPGVVLEEINMNEDDPADVAHDQFVTALWGEHLLAPPSSEPGTRSRRCLGRSSTATGPGTTPRSRR